MTVERNSKIRRWIDSNIGDQTGKNIIVTGANSGIGYETARILSQKGAMVVLGCRNLKRGEDAVKNILSENDKASVRLMSLDLSSQASIKQFVKEFRSEYRSLDILINNAGVMATPYSLTEDGYEWQFGTNHLGHFALTGLLNELLQRTSGSRVVVITSIAHYNGRINFNDLLYEQKYTRMGAYRRSKLANIFFAYELQRRFKKNYSDSISIAVHPGVSSTNIVKLPPFISRLKEMVLMSAAKGSLSILKGATDKDLSGGEYIGPSGFRESIGYPAILESSDQSHDRSFAKQLWSVSEELTGIKY